MSLGFELKYTVYNSLLQAPKMCYPAAMATDKRGKGGNVSAQLPPSPYKPALIKFILM